MHPSGRIVEAGEKEAKGAQDGPSFLLVGSWCGGRPAGDGPARRCRRGVGRQWRTVELAASAHPDGRAAPAPTGPDLAPAGQSPWVALNHPAPFSPGRCCSPATAPSTSTPSRDSGRHRRLVEAHPGRQGELRRRHLERDAADAGRLRPALLLLGDPARRPHDRGGRRVPRRQSGMDEQGGGATTRSPTRGSRSRRRPAGRTSATPRATCSPTARTCSRRRARTACRATSR